MDFWPMPLLGTKRFQPLEAAVLMEQDLAGADRFAGGVGGGGNLSAQQGCADGRIQGIGRRQLL